MICYLYDAPTYFFFAPGIPEILYYSHIPTTIAALLLGLFVLLHQPRNLLNQLLFLITVSFSVWTFSSLTSWTSVDADFIAFVWPLFAISSSLIAILSLYFALTFFRKKDVSFLTKLTLLLLLTPVLLFAHTNLSFSGFDLTNCDAFAYEGLLFKVYYTLLGFIAIAWIVVDAIRAYRKSKDEDEKKQIRLMAIGLEFFLFSFISSTFIITYLVNIDILPDSRLEMFGLFGMTFFIAMMSFLIVRFKAFSVGVMATQALVVALVIIVGAQFTYASTPTTLVLKSVSLLLTIIVGWMLVRSVKQEIEQRQQLEKLTHELAAANERLKELDKLKSEFVSIASHQLRSPITSIRGYASLLLDGSFGSIPQKAKEPLERIEKSSQLMAASIEDYLNVSRIESGNMKYNLTDFNLKDEVEHLCDDMRPTAIKQGLVLLFRSDLRSRGVVHADLGKTVQIVQNLITNSIKYTPEGSIKVLVRDDIVKKKIYVEIEDTGIGINQKALGKLFQKFERADNAHTVNTSGTGLGLFVAQKMAQAMGGDICAFSEGDGKGSRFTFTIPLAM